MASSEISIVKVNVGETPGYISESRKVGVLIAFETHDVGNSGVQVRSLCSPPSLIPSDQISPTVMVLLRGTSSGGQAGNSGRDARAPYPPGTWCLSSSGLGPLPVKEKTPVRIRPDTPPFVA